MTKPAGYFYPAGFTKPGLQLVQFFKAGGKAHQTGRTPAVSNTEEMADFVETDLHRPCKGDIFFWVVYPVQGYECGVTAQLGFTKDKSKDGGADVVPGNPQNERDLVRIRCQGFDNLQGVILTPDVLVGIFGYGLPGPNICIQAHYSLEVGGHHGYGQFVYSPQRDDVKVDLIMF